MNTISSLTRLGTTPGKTIHSFLPIRHASKKASAACKNPKQAPGPHWAIKFPEGRQVLTNDVIATQGRLRYHPGMNVAVLDKMKLRALKEGTVRITCERSDINYENSLVQKYYEGTEGTPIFKKYVHVIPKPQHNRFKLVRRV